MNILDLIVIICLLIFLTMGLMHGILKSISSLSALLLGFFLAKRYSAVASDLLGSLHIKDADGIFGYILIFLLFYIAIRIIFKLAERLTKDTALSVVNRLLGGAMGLTKGALIAMVTLTLTQIVLPDGSAIIEDSQAVPYSNRIISYAKAIVPGKIHEQLKG